MTKLCRNEIIDLWKQTKDSISQVFTLGQDTSQEAGQESFWKCLTSRVGTEKNLNLIEGDNGADKLKEPPWLFLQLVYREGWSSDSTVRGCSSQNCLEPGRWLSEKEMDRQEKTTAMLSGQLWCFGGPSAQHPGTHTCPVCSLCGSEQWQQGLLLSARGSLSLQPDFAHT